MMAHLLLLACATLGANAFQIEFDAANSAYTQGDFARAAEAYERIIASQAVDPVVFYNLGNAYLQLNRIGPAVANYERALRIAPRMEQARANRDLALSQAKRNLQKPLRAGWEQALLFWDESLSQRAVRNIAILFWLNFWIALGLRMLRRWEYSRAAAATIGIAALLAGLSAWSKANAPLLGVASVETVPVRYGPSDNEAVRFDLHEGDRFVVEQRNGGWSRVRTVDGERGWMREDQLSFVGPPYLPPPPAAAPKGQEKPT